MARARQGLGRIGRLLGDPPESPPAPAEQAAPPRTPRPPATPVKGPLNGLSHALGLAPPAPGARVVVLASAGDRSAAVAQLLARLGEQQVHVVAERAEPEWGLDDHPDVDLALAADLGQLNWQLKRLGPVSLVADLTTDPALPHLATWRRCHFHLRPRGLYLVRLAELDRDGRSADAGFVGLLGRVAAAQAGAGPASLDEADRPLGAACGRVFMGASLAAVVKRGAHHLKLRHAEVDRLLPTRDTDATVTLLGTVPAGTHVSRARVTSYGEVDHPVGFPESYAYPELRWREYTGRVSVATHSLLFCDATVLPESFRHHLARRMVNPRTTDVSDQFVRVPEEYRPTTTLEGRYFHLDTPFTGHFGHVMTETVSRLWAWDEAKRRDPGLKALLRTRFPNDRPPVVERTLLRAYGIAEEDVVFVDHPVDVTSVVGVTPMFHNHAPHYAHPGLAEVYARLGSMAVPPPTDATRIFVSRAGAFTNRSCRNVDEVERFFVERGYTVVHPETMSLPEQAGLFAQAEVVAGFAGSAMFNLMFARRLRAMVLLTHDAYDARNEYLIASVVGADLHYFWSASDVAHPSGGWSQEAFDSSWTFDVQRLGPDLDRLLRDLG